MTTAEVYHRWKEREFMRPKKIGGQIAGAVQWIGLSQYFPTPAN
jgi:hypothetical protein